MAVERVLPLGKLKILSVEQSYYKEQIKNLIASDQESNLLLAIHLAQANGLSVDYLAECIYYEASRKMTSCHGYPPSTIYDIKFYFSFAKGDYGLSFSVEGIPVEGNDFVHDFDQLLRQGGETYSLETYGLVPDISIKNSPESFSVEVVKTVLAQLLEQYLLDQN
jgi:hypothetical protein